MQHRCNIARAIKKGVLRMRALKKGVLRMRALKKAS
jgi:hypothetical protein